MAKDFWDEGDSPIYVGKLYLYIIAKQIDLIRQAQRISLILKGDSILGWLNELKILYDIIEFKLDLKNSDKKIPFKTYVIDKEKKKVIEEVIEIDLKKKFLYWFEKIEKMIERNQRVMVNIENKTTKYELDKKILLELSECTRALYFEADKKHLIMPEGRLDMKQLTKQEWLDRDPTKKFD